MPGHPNDLLLQCSLPAQDNLPQLISSIKADAGWERFLLAAEREGLAGLIFFNCRERSAGDLIPPEVYRSLEKSYLTTLARNILFLKKVDQVTGALAGLDFIVLKGAYLARRVYPSPGLRGFSDIDILVKRNDLAQVELRLDKIGYRPAEPGVALRGDGKDSSCFNSVMYYPAGGGIAVDVHWRLLNSMASNYLDTTMDIAEIWKAARASAGGGLELCPEHLVIHLAEHALHHSFERLILLRDIAEVIIRSGNVLDWNRLVGECRKFNLTRPVYYSLLLINMKTGITIPAEALAALRPARLGRAERLFLGLVLRGRHLPESCNLAYFDSLVSPRARIRFVLRLAFPGREVMALTCGKRPDEIGAGDYILRLCHGIRYLARGAFCFVSGRIKRASETR